MVSFLLSSPDDGGAGGGDDSKSMENSGGGVEDGGVRDLGWNCDDNGESTYWQQYLEMCNDELKNWVLNNGDASMEDLWTSWLTQVNRIAQNTIGRKVRSCVHAE